LSIHSPGATLWTIASEISCSIPTDILYTLGGQIKNRPPIVEMSQASTRMMLEHGMPQMLHSAAMPMVEKAENKDILRSAMVTPEVRHFAHEKNILMSGLGHRSKHHVPELMKESSMANKKANGPVPKTPNHIGSVRFPGSKY
jgi:hypothetical protein